MPRAYSISPHVTVAVAQADTVQALPERHLPKGLDGDGAGVELVGRHLGEVTVGGLPDQRLVLAPPLEVGEEHRLGLCLGHARALGGAVQAEALVVAALEPDGGPALGGCS